MVNPSGRILVYPTGILKQGHNICSGELYSILEWPFGMTVGPSTDETLDHGAPSKHVPGTAHNELALLDLRCHKVSRLSSSPSQVKSTTLEIKFKQQQGHRQAAWAGGLDPHVTQDGCTSALYLVHFLRPAEEKEKYPCLIYRQAVSVFELKLKMDDRRL